MEGRRRVIKTEEELERLKAALRPASVRDLILHWAVEVRLFEHKPLCGQRAGSMTSMEQHVNCRKCVRQMESWE